jgi:replicative DNA helicase
MGVSGDSALRHFDQLPHDLDAERAVLGAMMVNEAAASVLEDLAPDDFFRLSHGLLFRIMGDMRARHSDIDPVTVSGELARLGQLAEVGGRAYVHTLYETVPAATRVHSYATIVRRCAAARRVARAGLQIRELAIEGGLERDELAREALRLVARAVGVSELEDEILKAAGL